MTDPRDTLAARSEAAFNSQTSIRLDTAELDRIVAGLEVNIEAVMRAFAFEVEAEAKTLAPYKFGALKNSIYTNVKGGGGSQPNKTSDTEQYEDIPEAEGNVIAVVGSGLDYAGYQEFGTSRMASSPFLGPAVEHQGHKLNDGETWKRLFEK